jgi:hypothetical protein
MDVKLVVKLAAILLIYILRPDFNFGLRIRHSRLPLFYAVAIGISILNYFLCLDFSASYTVLVLTGILFWAASLLAIHQLKGIVEETDKQVLHHTLFVFFMINVAASLLNLSLVFADIGIRNPFTYQGQFQKYFMNTGDHIKGISFDSSTTNAVICLFGIIYFLYRKQFAPMLACMVVLLLTGSNLINGLLAVVFLFLFLFRSSREQKSMMAICMFLLIVFLAKVSPQNNQYINRLFREYVLQNKAPLPVLPEPVTIRFMPDSLLDEEKRKEKFATLYLDSVARVQSKPFNSVQQASFINLDTRPQIPGDSIHTATFQSSRDSTTVQRQLAEYINNKLGPGFDFYMKGSPLPGKAMAFCQSFHFLMNHPAKILLGDGTGNFSSKLAFRATGLKMAGSFPQRFVYSHDDFLQNHLSVYAWFFTQPGSTHSVIHAPASVYNQLLMEYGLAGMMAFVFFYLFYFGRQWKKMSYGIPLLAVLPVIFLTDYWFEQLSVVVLFELMMFTDMKKINIQPDQHA